MTDIRQTFKVALVGDQKVGKTMWIKRLKQLQPNRDETGETTVDVMTSVGVYRFVIDEMSIETFKQTETLYEMIIVMINTRAQDTFESARDFIKWIDKRDTLVIGNASDKPWNLHDIEHKCVVSFINYLLIDCVECNRPHIPLINCLKKYFNDESIE